MSEDPSRTDRTDHDDEDGRSVDVEKAAAGGILTWLSEKILESMDE